MKKIILFSVVAFIFMFSNASAKDVKSITADELKKMIDSKMKLTLVDARTEMEYAQGHIPKALNIPPDKLNIIGTLLPKNRQTLVIIYCRGVD
ncbi:MAG: rhodanese-like domain-containing protein [Nitrospiraceae bacterium]|nr:MAG: rhodanese-like domain-containing protein [Nitrospiraceae bacterium]